MWPAKVVRHINTKATANVQVAIFLIAFCIVHSLEDILGSWKSCCPPDFLINEAYLKTESSDHGCDDEFQVCILNDTTCFEFDFLP